MLGGVPTVVCVLPGPILRLGPGQFCVGRILPIGDLRRRLLFLYHFWQMVPAVWYIYVLEERMFEVCFCFLLVSR